LEKPYSAIDGTFDILYNIGNSISRTCWTGRV